MTYPHGWVCIRWFKCGTIHVVCSASANETILIYLSNRGITLIFFPTWICLLSLPSNSTFICRLWSCHNHILHLCVSRLGKQTYVLGHWQCGDWTDAWPNELKSYRCFLRICSAKAKGSARFISWVWCKNMAPNQKRTVNLNTELFIHSWYSFLLAKTKSLDRPTKNLWLRCCFVVPQCLISSLQLSCFESIFFFMMCCIAIHCASCSQNLLDHHVLKLII